MKLIKTGVKIVGNSAAIMGLIIVGVTEDVEGRRKKRARLERARIEREQGNL